MLKHDEDAYGMEMMAYLEGEAQHEIVEREDGYIDVSVFALSRYFAEYKDWPELERKAFRYVRGRVLDLGCGVGRCCLYLQNKGHEVVGIDTSPLAIKICRQRGVKHARLMSITEVSDKLGPFDTILMAGNNFGLFANFKRARRLLKRFHQFTPRSGRIVAEVCDPYKTRLAEHLRYHEQNRQRGRMGGQLRIRIRFRKYRTSWFDYLFVSPDELHEILRDTGWQVGQELNPGHGPYIVVLEKDRL